MENPIRGKIRRNREMDEGHNENDEVEEADERLQRARKESEDYLQRGKELRFMHSTPAEDGESSLQHHLHREKYG